MPAGRVTPPACATPPAQHQDKPRQPAKASSQRRSADQPPAAWRESRQPGLPVAGEYYAGEHHEEAGKNRQQDDSKRSLALAIKVGGAAARAATRAAKSSGRVSRRAGARYARAAIASYPRIPRARIKVELRPAGCSCACHSVRPVSFIRNSNLVRAHRAIAGATEQVALDGAAGKPVMRQSREWKFFQVV